MITVQIHERSKAKSYENLANARKQALEERKYDSTQAREEIRSAFCTKFGKSPYEWQMDVAEAITLGLDNIVIAGTGSGKTMPFMMPLLNDRSKKTIIISPLKVLQEEQAERFAKMGISAAAVHGETWSQQLDKDLRAGKIQAILTSPEMCLKHPQFRSFLSDASIADQVAMVVIDEAHCITQWGPEFRKEYAQLLKLRTFFPVNVPLLVTSATVSPEDLREIQSLLNLRIDDAFFIHLGNDRPNIRMSAQVVASPRDFEAVRALLTKNGADPRCKEDLVKTTVFVNEVMLTHRLVRYLKRVWPPELHQYIDFIHAYRQPETKRRVMKEFEEGTVLILAATESAGMGADIPDIELVIQLGVPSSLSVWIQRAGRAGRSPDINARAILLVEESVFQTRTAKKPGGSTNKNTATTPTPTATASTTTTPTPTNTAEVEVEPVKNVEGALRRWIETTGCRRDVIDEHFANPPGRKPPTNGCCDNCIRGTLSRPSTPSLSSSSRCSTPVSRPQTPESQSPPSSAHSTPSKRRNGNGKRPMVTAQPQRRGGAHLKNVQEALRLWRARIKKDKLLCTSLGVAALFPDRFLTAMASSRDIHSLEDLEAHTKLKWVFGPELFDKAFAVIVDLDAAEDARKAENKRQKQLESEARQLKQQLEREEKARKTAEAKAERARVKEMERQRKEEERQERERVKEEKRQEKLAQALQKAQEQARQAAERDARRAMAMTPVTPMPAQHMFTAFQSTPMSSSPLGALSFAPTLTPTLGPSKPSDFCVSISLQIYQ